MKIDDGGCERISLRPPLHDAKESIVTNNLTNHQLGAELCTGGQRLQVDVVSETTPRSKEMPINWDRLMILTLWAHLGNHHPKCPVSFPPARHCQKWSNTSAHLGGIATNLPNFFRETHF